MVTRCTFLLVLGAAMLGCVPAAWSQPNKLFRIGYLANDPEPNSPTFVEFRQTLAKQGWRVDFVNENIKEGANREERLVGCARLRHGRRPGPHESDLCRSGRTGGFVKG